MPIIKTTADTTGMIRFVSSIDLTISGGFLYCDGSALSRITYAALFNIIGTTYNTGGETPLEFRIPDLRGKTIVGSGLDTDRELTNRVLGQYGGKEAHALSNTELPLHTHTATTSSHNSSHSHTSSLDTQSNNINNQNLDTHTHDYTYTEWQNNSDAGGGKSAQAGNTFSTSGTNASLAHSHTYTTSGPIQQHNHSFSTNLGNSLNGVAHNNMQPSLVAGFYIKY